MGRKKLTPAEQAELEQKRALLINTLGPSAANLGTRPEPVPWYVNFPRMMAPTPPPAPAPAPIDPRAPAAPGAGKAALTETATWPEASGTPHEGLAERAPEQTEPAVPTGSRPPEEPTPKDAARETPPIDIAADTDKSKGLLYPGNWDENKLRDDFDAQGKPISNVSEVVAAPWGDKGRAVVLPVLPGSTAQDEIAMFTEAIRRGEKPSHLGVYDSLEAAQQAADRLAYQLHPVAPGMSQTRLDEPLAERGGEPAGPPPATAAPLAASAAASEPPRALSQREQLQEKIDQYVSTMLDRPENDAAGTMARVSTPGGKRPNLYGYEDEAGYDMDQRAARVRELYQQEKPSTHWTDEYLRTHEAPVDAQGARIRAGITRFLGSSDEASKLYDRFAQERQAYDQGLTQARQMDLLQSQVPLETAQALAQSGLSPEAAVRARRGGPEVSAYKSGGYAGGATLTGHQRAYDKAVLEELGKAAGRREEGGQKLIQEEIGRTRAIEQAQAQKRGGIDEQLGQRLVANYLGTRAFPKWGAERAMQWVQTRDPSLLPEGISPEQAEAKLVEAQTNLLSTKGRESLAPGPGLGAQERRKVVEMQNNPAFIKHMQGIHEANKTARDALAAYYALPEEAKKSLVQLGRSVPDVIRSMVSHSSGKPWEADTVAVRELVGKMMNENAGLAVTDNELQNAAGRTGMTADWYDPFRSGEGLEAAIKNRIKLIQTRLEPWQKFLEPVE